MLKKLVLIIALVLSVSACHIFGAETSFMLGDQLPVSQYLCSGKTTDNTSFTVFISYYPSNHQVTALDFFLVVKTSPKIIDAVNDIFTEKLRQFAQEPGVNVFLMANEDHNQLFFKYTFNLAELDYNSLLASSDNIASMVAATQDYDVSAYLRLFENTEYQCKVSEATVYIKIISQLK